MLHPAVSAGMRIASPLCQIISAVLSCMILYFTGHALAMSAIVIAGMNTVGFAITALTKSHKITDLTVGVFSPFSMYFTSW